MSIPVRLILIAIPIHPTCSFDAIVDRFGYSVRVLLGMCRLFS
jgi:hypothetical protein